MHNRGEPSDGSVTQWIAAAKRGDPVADNALWNRYSQRLLALARRKLGGVPTAVADEEDVVVAAVNSFLGGVRASRFAQLESRDDLWQILAMLTTRKAANQRHHWQRTKRGGPADSPASREPVPLDGVPSAGPLPDDEAIFVENLRILCVGLETPLLRSILEGKLAGHTTSELSQQLGVTSRTIERKVALIRQKAERLL